MGEFWDSGRLEFLENCEDFWKNSEKFWEKMGNSQGVLEISGEF